MRILRPFLFGLILILCTTSYSDDSSITLLKPIFQSKPRTPASATSPLWTIKPTSKALAKKLFPLFEKTYKDIGKLYESPRQFQNASQVTAWAKDPVTGKPIAYFSFKNTAFGLKVTTLGQDGEQHSRTLVRAILPQLGSRNGIYVEVSDRLANAFFAEKPTPPLVSFETAKKILERDTPEEISKNPKKKKTIERPSPEEIETAVKNRKIPDTPEARANCYKRIFILDGKETPLIKIMVGHPYSDPTFLAKKPAESRKPAEASKTDKPHCGVSKDGPLSGEELKELENLDNCLKPLEKQ